ncbi:MAG TPA: type II secretion system F family protein [Clostridia bacterium]|nr:type II secretion system F family protein [Clostridia bacterium]
MAIFILLMVFFFISVYSLITLLLDSVKTGKRITSERIEEIIKGDVGFKIPDLKKNKRGKKKLNLNYIYISKNLAEDIDIAGLDIRGEEFIFIWILVAVVPAFLVYSITESMIKTILCIAIFAAIPPIYLRLKISRKRVEFEKQLEGSLQVLANGVRSGFSFQQALNNLSKDMPDPLGAEFRAANREIRLGIDVETAFSKIAQRMDSEDIEILTAAIIIQQQVGGSLSTILDSISGTIRDRLNMKALVRTLTAQGRISGLIIGVIPIGLLGIISVVNPEYTEIFFNTTYGHILLAIAIVLESIGFLVIRKIIDIKF